MNNYYKMALSLLPSSYELSFGEIQILRAEFVPRVLDRTKSNYRTKTNSKSSF